MGDETERTGAIFLGTGLFGNNCLALVEAAEDLFIRGEPGKLRGELCNELGERGELGIERDLSDIMGTPAPLALLELTLMLSKKLLRCDAAVPQ